MTSIDHHWATTAIVRRRPRIATPSYRWDVLSGPRLRQVALVARDCGQVAGELRRAFGWPEVLGLSAAGSGHALVVELPDSGQRLRFVPARGGRGEGITEVTIPGLPGGGPWMIGGVRFTGEEG
jgi:hypothetical protein